MGNLKIGVRLVILIATLLGALLVVGVTSFIGLTRTSTALSEVDLVVQQQKNMNSLVNIVGNRVFLLVSNVNLGTLSWEQAATQLAALKTDYQTTWSSLEQRDPLVHDLASEEDMHSKEKEAASEGAEEKSGQIRLEQGKALIEELFQQTEALLAGRDRGYVNLFLANDLAAIQEELRTSFLEPHLHLYERAAQQITQNAASASRTARVIEAVVAVLGLILAVFLGLFIYRSITEPVETIANTVQRVTEGDFTIRTGLTGDDELATLGRGFDQLLDERLATLVQAEQENESLNDSIILLLQGVSQLSQRDLTVKVPVKEDVTGPMADALNLLTTETAKVLSDVTQVSEDVALASNKVREQSDTVMAVANTEREEVERAAVELTAAAADMNQIAELARSCNQIAEEAIETTRKALETVEGTVDGITSTRDTIRETEKRIKRLGERSQEISGVVNLINTIAERTHILALNASMHAASAGEAGRGFAVVADEVQRLAENAREATAQITTLVSSIQVETADTVNAMNQAITQVVEGSRMAEQAGDQMRKTQQTTAELVAAVQQIATRSQAQAHISNALLERARQIQRGTVQTGERLQEQSQYTDNLVGYAQALVDAVRVFKLPAPGSA